MADADPMEPLPSRPKFWRVGLAFLVFGAALRLGVLADQRSRAGQSALIQAAQIQAQHSDLTINSSAPPRGSKQVLVRVYNDISDHRVMALAAGMTFYSLLAIFPALAAIVAIYGLFSDPSTIMAHLDDLSGFMPGGALEVAKDQLTRVASKGGQTLGLTFIGGLAVSLWSANAAMKSMFDTLNVINDEQEKRSFVRLNAISMSFTLGTILIALVAVGAVVVLPVALNYISFYVGISDQADALLRVGRWPVLFVVIALALSLIYRFGPSHEASRWRLITWGSALAAFLWLGASALFSWYAANFGNYNETYGSLGAVIGFMTWLWISAIVVLIGAELDAELEARKVPSVPR